MLFVTYFVLMGILAFAFFFFLVFVLRLFISFFSSFWKADLHVPKPERKRTQEYRCVKAQFCLCFIWFWEKFVLRMIIDSYVISFLRVFVIFYFWETAIQGFNDNRLTRNALSVHFCNYFLIWKLNFVFISIVSNSFSCYKF